MNRTALLKSIAAGGVALTLWISPAGADTPTQLDVRIENVDTAGGPVRVAMFEEGRWLSDTVVADAQAPASAPAVSVRLTAPRADRYGLAIYQDLNRDGQLNRNIVGLPTEPVAFSNGASIQFGPPSFAAAAFRLSAEGGAMTVRLH